MLGHGTFFTQIRNRERPSIQTPLYPISLPPIANLLSSTVPFLLALSLRTLISFPQLPIHAPRTLPQVNVLISSDIYSIVVSIAAILILSIIGGLFKSEHHSMVGSTKDPKDGKAVAGSVFAAVAVYAVRLESAPSPWFQRSVVRQTIEE